MKVIFIELIFCLFSNSDRFQEESNNNNFDPAAISQEYTGEDNGSADANPTDASFLPNTDSANDVPSTASTYDAGYASNGNQVNVQASNFGPSSIQHSSSFVPNSQQYSALQQDSNGGSSSFIPQILHRISDEDRKNYLPPNYRL